MKQLSKSKLIAFRQCPKRLWLEVHAPELRNDTASWTPWPPFESGNFLKREMLERTELGVSPDSEETNSHLSQHHSVSRAEPGNLASDNYTYTLIMHIFRT